jgi:hypothetical protein
VVRRLPGGREESRQLFLEMAESSVARYHHSGRFRLTSKPYLIGSRGGTDVVP